MPLVGPSLRCLLGASLVMLLAVTAVSGQATISNSCEVPATVNRFSKQKFDGNWFVFATSLNSLDPGWICRRHAYSETGNLFRYNYKTSTTAPFVAYEGTYQFPNDNVGFAEITMGVVPLNKVYIVAGDLENWAIIRSCFSVGLLTLKYAYILTRTPNPSDAVKAAINKGIAAAGVDPSGLRRVQQSGC